MTIANKFGVDVSKLEHTDDSEHVIRDVIPGRVVQIDADFLAYQVSYDDEKSIDEMQNNADAAIKRIMEMSGAESSVLHLTPKGSNKGGRYESAILKEYQANRQNKIKPRFLHIIREWMHKERGAILHMDCEADDGMSMAQYKAIGDGNKNLSIIATKDKDLLMVPGLMLDWDTGEITDTKDDDFGWIEIKVMPNKSKTKKVVGRGWKYFWAQMLTGDNADNISGIPIVYDDRFYTKSGKPKKCGPVLAYEILEQCNTNLEAYETVRNLYKAYSDNEGFVHWKTGERVDFGDVFLSEASLLWMRRYSTDEFDVIDWMLDEVRG